MNALVSRRPYNAGSFAADNTTLAQTSGGLFAEVWRRQPVLTAVALLFLLAMIPTSIAAQFDTRTVNGISVWVKPTKFLLSLAVYYATLAWYFGYLPRAAQSTRVARFVVWGAIVVGVAEMFWLIAAAVAGVPAHFNRTSAVWAGAYFAAGAGATTLLIAMLLQARMIARDGLATLSPAFRAAVVIGAQVAFFGTLITAFVLAGGAGHWVGGATSDANGLALVGWSRTGGDLRVAHFWALHAQQLLPLSVWALTKRFDLSRAAVRWLAVGYVAFVALTFGQALMGLPFIG